ncbi:MAG: helix-turn-helix domain-containing protein [Ghiorsea sp.]
MSNKLQTNIKEQCNRLTAALHKEPMTTVSIRKNLDIMSPAARIFELRHKYGYEIDVRMVTDETYPNQKHKVALYSLISEVQK